MDIISMVTTILIPMYCRWRTEVGQKKIREPISYSEKVVWDCEDFIRRCVIRQDTTELLEMQQEFDQSGNEGLAATIDNMIDELSKYSTGSMMRLHSYLESDDFYNEVLKNVPSE